jgi:hypothetical protein
MDKKQTNKNTFSVAALFDVSTDNLLRWPAPVRRRAMREVADGLNVGARHALRPVVLDFSIG